MGRAAGSLLWHGPDAFFMKGVFPEMTIQRMLEIKQEKGYTNDYIARLSGVPLGTVQKILGGITRSPRRENVRKLEEFFSNSEYTATADRFSQSQYPMVREALAAYGIHKKQGEYTIDDYFAIPDDQRVELIDGVIYDMAAPNTGHQAIGGFVYKLLLDHVLTHGGSCMPLMSPLDVQLDENNKTMVQPDVLIVCDRKRFRDGRVFGAPDFLAEVLSPSTRKKDMTLKLFKYSHAGVREYWVIDPKTERVIVYDFEHDDYPVIYSFRQKVPVRIWDSACEIDFAMIMEHVSFLYDDSEG